ncbi:Ion channel [Nesidiocoris tenuis]|uniref:Ion channel n=1 Tax=Nesidiocoris tenuis TaxID=355587 RepID=A0ABN7AP94_9HEMI|nr:Ion channel [Nesidiocoris tenuis]
MPDILLDELEKLYRPIRELTIDDLAYRIIFHCNIGIANDLNETFPVSRVGESTEPEKWTYYNAFFFALTTLSTIGYGNLFPTSDGSRMILVLYALIGVPFTGIILSRLGDFFGSRLLRAHHRYKNHIYDSKLTLVLDVLIYLVPGMVVFIVAPMFLFAHNEGWSYPQAFYYAFITLTTIGFGDLVAGQSSGTETLPDVLYKIFIIVWIMFGLGYLIMILGFITRAMKSKTLAKMEQKIASSFKATQSKIWNEFLDDVNIMRRALNEAYINRVKPVYREKQPLWVTSDRRSNSMPNLSEWPEAMTREELEEWNETQALGAGKAKRRRALSEGVATLEAVLPRVMSEGALEDIDIESTFKDRPRPSLAHQDLQTEEFLSQIVSQRRLSVFDPTLHEGGFDLFSDDEILDSELAEKPTSNYDSLRYRPKRNRARSDAFFALNGGESRSRNSLYDHQITWSGADSLHAQTMIKNMRARAAADMEAGAEKLDKPSPAANFRRLSVAAINFFSGDKKKKEEKKKKSDKNQNHRPSLFEEDDDLPFNPDLFSGARRPSLLDVLGPLPTSGENTPMGSVLEQTTIADFIRIMSTLRSLEAAGGFSQQDVNSTFATAPPGVSSARESRHPSLSHLFAGQSPAGREVLRAKGAVSTGNLPAKARRYSQAPVRRDDQSFRRRAASISQGGNFSDVRRSGRFASPMRPSATPASALGSNIPAPPSLVVTSPDGQHRFRVESVRRTDQLPSHMRRYRGSSLSEL